MDKYPLLWQGKSAGELTVTEEGLYTCFDCACRLPGEGIWCAWAVGADGQLRLGVLEPEGRRGRIRRRFSRQMTAPLGKLLRGEVRPAAEGAEDWAPLDMGKEPLRTPWLQKALAGTAFETPLTDEADFIARVRAGEGKIVRKQNVRAR